MRLFVAVAGVCYVRTCLAATGAFRGIHRDVASSTLRRNDAGSSR